MRELLLTVRDFAGTERWSWELTGPDGRILARHDVRLDPFRPEYEAFWDLAGHVRRHAPPDQRVAREREIVREVGAWIGTEVLGPVAPALLASAPAVVRVVVPQEVPDARRLLFVPLELAHARGRPLALQDVTLVMRTDAADGRAGARWARESQERPVRVLALFSLPQGSRALNLRRERIALTSLFSGTGRAVEVRALQYGVSRQRLRSVLAEPGGWDIVHVSGHGTPGELLLETDAGRPDRVTAGALAELLSAARRVGLVTLSSCWSAALTAGEQRRVLGVPVADAGEAGAPDGVAPDVGVLAGELVGRLGCAVLAMRYPVADRFAVALAEGLYRRLVGEGLPLPRALAGALTEAAAQGGPELSAATPALFGERAATLRVRAARADDRGGDRDTGTAREDTGTVHEATGTARADTGTDPVAAGPGLLPPLPRRFVGRVGVMARVSALLAPGSGRCGAVLVGMPGAGKTACARETVETHRHAFEKVVWFKVPELREADADTHAQGAPSDLALALREAGVPCPQPLDDEESAAAFAAAVAEGLARHRLLLVVDHVDALLTADGTWRDPLWARLTAALSGHSGPGRALLTCRTRPPGAGPLLPSVPVDLLSADEAVLLARELPRLAALAEGRGAGLAPHAARAYATAVLEVTRGHPRLLELADAQAADPGRLTALLGTAGRAWSEGGGLPEGFFTGAGGEADGDDCLRVLGAWAEGIVGRLPPAHADLFRFLCCLEEADRVGPCVEHNWPDLRERVGHPAEPLATGLAALAERGLLGPRPTAGGMAYDIQAAVAAQGRAQAGPRLRRLVDERMAGYWTRVFQMAWQREGTDAQGASAAGPLLARAGLSAAPYLIRIGLAQGAEALLQAVVRRDGSRPTVARVMPVLHRIAALAASGDGTAPPTAALLEVLSATDPAAAERMTRAALERELRRGDPAGVSAAAGQLAGLCLRAGRLREALELIDTEIACARAAGLTGWAGLLGEVHRLHVLSERRGRAAQVLEEAAVLRRRMDALPRAAEPDSAGGTVWWQVWEEFCDIVQRAAIQAERWETALESNGELCAVKAGRGAPRTDVAEARFPAYMPLLRLGRTGEAIAVLEECREVFEAADATALLGEVFGALATVEHARGRGPLALARGRDCLRYAYRGGLPSLIAVAHANYGTYLHTHARDAAGALAHHLAGALLGLLTGGRTADALSAAVDDVLVFGTAAARLPAGPQELCARAGEVPGVALDRLLERLAPEPGRLAEVFTAALRQVRGTSGAAAGRAAVTGRAVWLLIWEPVLGALVAAERGNTVAGVKLRQHLDRWAALDERFVPLTGVLRRVLDGERDPAAAAALGPLDAEVARRALAALRGEADVRPELWPVMHLGPALGHVVTAATGGGPTAEGGPAGKGTDGKGADGKGTGVGAREVLDGFRADPALAPVASALEQIVAGSRLPAHAVGLELPAHQAMVLTVLRYVGEIEGA
ncbi:CHAT domain-containing protein [Streptomyces sp. enrichment culture]|uniref:CHAT domain-containing protein n=1 Tax=Streptomyces sp. enrichment culture TaxID=1795815 RepID=UPI003F56FC49